MLPHGLLAGWMFSRGAPAAASRASRFTAPSSNGRTSCRPVPMCTRVAGEQPPPCSGGLAAARPTGRASSARAIARLSGSTYTPASSRTSRLYTVSRATVGAPHAIAWTSAGLVPPTLWPWK